MTTYYRRVPTQFAPATTFDLRPRPAARSRVGLDAELETLKSRLLKEHLATVADPALVPVLRRAANEAAALVWLTPFPLLLLPALLEEKAAAAKDRAAKQDQIRHRSRELFAA